MCICGVPFALSYFINVAVLKKFEFFWFVRYGFLRNGCADGESV